MALEGVRKIEIIFFYDIRGFTPWGGRRHSNRSKPALGRKESGLHVSFGAWGWSSLLSYRHRRPWWHRILNSAYTPQANHCSQYFNSLFTVANGSQSRLIQKWCHKPLVLLCHRSLTPTSESTSALPRYAPQAPCFRYERIGFRRIWHLGHLK